ncbi:hypothetical protein V8C37DRAFT_11221 [Trichoderma ceciliae]
MASDENVDSQTVAGEDGENAHSLYVDGFGWDVNGIFVHDQPGMSIDSLFGADASGGDLNSLFALDEPGGYIDNLFVDDGSSWNIDDLLVDDGSGWNIDSLFDDDGSGWNINSLFDDDGSGWNIDNLFDDEESGGNVDGPIHIDEPGEGSLFVDDEPRGNADGPVHIDEPGEDSLFVDDEPGKNANGPVNVDEFDNEIVRCFRPNLSEEHRHIPEHELVTFNRSKMISQLQKMDPTRDPLSPSHPLVTDKSSLVVSIAGRYRVINKSTGAGHAVWGVHFGQLSPYNAYGVVHPSLPQTKCRADIEALSQALRIIRQYIFLQDFTLRNVVIRCHSDYLVRSMTGGVELWAQNRELAWLDGQPLAHPEDLLQTLDFIREMTDVNFGALDFKFWFIDPLYIRGAISLVQLAHHANVSH